MSDQATRQFRFAWRSDPAPLTAASWSYEVAYGVGVGGCAATQACSDNHINLKSHGGRLYAAVKTRLNDGATRVDFDPLIAVLPRSPGGQWDAFQVSSPWALARPPANE